LTVSGPGASRRRGRGPRAGSPSFTAPRRALAVPRPAALVLAAALLGPLGGCALLPTPPQTRALLAAPPADLPPRAERADTPFYPQTEYECGPAALATALGAAGIAVRPEALTEQVYLPARRGSLQLEMLATARRRGALAVRLPGTLDALLHEVAAGRPVVVLQNLSLPIAPRWHYAVVVGYDLAGRELLLRSGTTERLAIGLTPFEHTWARSGHWAFVAVPPGELPAAASEAEVTAASVAFERVAEAAAARRAYEAALARWPGNLTLAIGVGNTRYAAGDLGGAAEAFEAAAQRHDSAAAWINLAELRLQQGRRDLAEAAARRAVARAVAEPGFAAEAAATLDKALGATR
jgi:hypothetical protein